MEGGKASAGQQGRRGKKALGCRAEREKLKDRHREQDRMTEREKGQRAGQHWGGEGNNRDGQWDRGMEKEKNTEEERKERRDS